MADVVCTVEDTAAGSDHMVVDWSCALVSTASAAAAETQDLFAALEGTADASESVDVNKSYDVVSSAAASDSVAPGAVLNETDVSSALAFESVVREVATALSSSADASEAVDAEVPIDIVSTAAASDAVAASRSVDALLESTATATDGVARIVAASVESTADAADSVADQADPALVSTAAASDAVSATRVVEVLAESVAAASDALIAGLVAVTELESKGVARDRVAAPRAGDAAFWTNSESMAAATWPGAALDSFAMVGDTLYAVGEGGLYALDDEAGAIDARVVSDNMDFGAGQKKRVNVVYSGGWQGQPMKWTVTTEQGSWSYVTRPSNYGGTTNYRVTLGKGLTARFMRFEHKNVAGAPFDVKDNTLLVDAGKRRIGG